MLVFEPGYRKDRTGNKENSKIWYRMGKLQLSFFKLKAKLFYSSKPDQKRRSIN